MIHTGEWGAYRWLTSTEHYSKTLVRLCPEVLLDQYLAVTTIAEQAAGWNIRGGVAYSSRVTLIDLMVYGPDTPGFDEWYVFDTIPDLGEVIRGNPFNEPLKPGRLMIFVNFPAFALHDSSGLGLADMFWEQIGWVQPESYVADGRDHFTFVSRNAALYQRVLNAFENDPSVLS